MNIYFVASLCAFGAMDSQVFDDVKKAINYKNKLLKGEGFVKTDPVIVVETHIARV